MKRLGHGAILLDGDQPAVAPLDVTGANENTIACPEPSRFDYLFCELQKLPSKLLPEDETTAQTLIDLGNSMSDPEPQGFKTPALPEFDSTIPSVYSYFGQFITHETVLESTTKNRKLGPDTLPLDEGQIPQLTNARTALLDLDSIYGPMLDEKGKCYPVPVKGAEMEVGYATFSTVRGTDLPREPGPSFTARIGDPRNDANLITSQMHLAFLRAHNALVTHGESFSGAQKLLRQHFQWLVVYDYLPRVVDSQVLKSILEEKTDILARPEPFMPVEFSAAAFRFGHSMPRHRYNYNKNYDKVRLFDLFLPRQGGYPPVLEEWIIDWNQFIPGGANIARRIDTRLVQALFSHLIDSQGKHIELSLAALDLLRGYLLRLPTGQAVATAIGGPVMSATEIESVAEKVNPEQKAILAESGLSSRTPLWFYILAEAAHFKDGLCLGPVGSAIVAGVLIGLVRRSTDSILSEPDWAPTLGTGHFDLAQLFKLAGV